MSLAIHITIRDFATPAVEAKLAKCEPRRLAAIVGPPMAEFWRDRLNSLGTNRRGWPTTRFWERAARAVTQVPGETSVVLVCDQQGVRQRWKGGPIAPVKAEALAIPISPVSYGKTPAQFPGLWLLVCPKGAYLVQTMEVQGPAIKRRQVSPKGMGGNSGRRQRAGLNFLFKLSAGVEQEGDDRVVPEPEEFLEIALARIDMAIQ